MAFSDYGTIIFKNGEKLEDRSWCCVEEVFGKDFNCKGLKDIYHGIAGDRKCFIAFYKQTPILWHKGKETTVLDNFFCLNAALKSNMSPAYLEVDFEGVSYRFYPYESNSYILEFTDSENNQWECYFGYGVGYNVLEWWEFIGVEDAENKIIKERVK